MASTTIDRLTINWPYEEPGKHWRYAQETRPLDLAVAYWQRGDYTQSRLAVIDCQSRGIPLDPEFIRQLQEDSGQVGPVP